MRVGDERSGLGEICMHFWLLIIVSKVYSNGRGEGAGGGVWEVLHNLGWSWDFLLYARGWLTLPRPAPAQVDKRPLQDHILEGRSTGNAEQHLPHASGYCDFQHSWHGQLTTQSLGQAV